MFYSEDKPKEKKKLRKATIFGTLLTAVVLSASMFVKSEEDPADENIAYLNAIGNPMICADHTKGVKLGDIASDKECNNYAREDYATAVTQLISVSPNLADNPNALQASADLVVLGGLDSYRVSPMRHYFDKGNWKQGCLSFLGYRTRFLFSKRKPGEDCQMNPDKTWLCTIDLIIKKRERESNICQGIKETSDVKGAKH